MSTNKNYLDIEFEVTQKIQKKFKHLSKSIMIVAEKENDSLVAVLILNNTDKTVELSTQDYRLHMIQEAKDQNGNWKPIEYWTDSWCGNSYSSQFLQPDKIIKTLSTLHKGSFKTELRIKLLEDNKVYYSNPFMGEIELSEFQLNDSVKQKSRYNEIKRVAGPEIAEKVLFLEPSGMKQYLEKFKAWQNEMAEKRKQNK